MNLRSMGTHAIVAAVFLSSIAAGSAQSSSSVKANSATHATAEMTKGTLSPDKSKAGDLVELKLKEDVKSNGQVILKKGTTITGVVTKVKRLDAAGDARGQAQSVIQVEWLTPGRGRPAQELSITLESVVQVSRLFRDGDDPFDNDSGAHGGGLAAGATGGPSHSGGPGLLGGTAAAGVTAVGSTVGIAMDSARTTAAGAGSSNIALLSMPSVVAADFETRQQIDAVLGTPASSPFFKTGRGELVSPTGMRQSLELFSSLNNDTVITSQHKNFEVSSGAQAQFLVGVNKK